MDISEICYDMYKEEDSRRFFELTKSGVLAIFVYDKMLYKGGAREWIDEKSHLVRPEFKDGVIFAPECVFARLSGGRVEKNEIFVKDKCLKFAAGDKKYTLSGKEHEFATAPYSRHGHTYLPLKESAEALGLGAVLLYDGRLCVFGDSDVISTLAAEARKNPAIGFAGADTVIGEYETAHFTSADFKAAKDKWRELLVSTPEKIDLSDTVLKKKILSVFGKS